MKPRRLPRAAARPVCAVCAGPAGFTLVELVVSVAVLSLLVLVIAQLFSGATMTATGSRKHLDADSVARAVFDRMADDFQRIVKRPDVDYDFAKEPPSGASLASGSNDSIYFYSESSGYPGASGTLASTVSLVGYRINPNYQLERLGQRLAWNAPAGSGSAVTFLTNVSNPPPLETGTIANDFFSVINDTNSSDPTYYYDVIGDGVFRLEYCFQLRDGTYSDKAYLAPDTQCDGTGLSDVAAIVVAIAVIDPASRNTVPVVQGVPQFGKAAALLPDFNPSQSVQGSLLALMDQQWNAAWNTSVGNTQVTGLPKAAATQVRIYQRYFYLNNK